MSYGAELYGTHSYAQEDIKNEQIESHIPDLMKYLPNYYKESAVMKSLEQSLAKEIGKINTITEDILYQLFIDTATWGLELWEKELGLQADYSKSYSRRREVVRAKLRGYGTTTKEMIKNVAAAFSGGEVEVLEYNSEYKFVIQFIGVKGIPPNMAGLIQAIEDIKPAHLVYSFKYTYTTWNMITGLTWAGSTNKTWSELRTYEGE